MAKNRATIYSNGIADFQRVFKVTKTKPTQIALPVRQQHLGDVLASLTVSGDVKIDSPPSFQPANSDDSNIRVDTSNAIISLAKQLSGSNVEIIPYESKKKLKGRLIGLHSQDTATEGQPVSDDFLVIQTQTGIKKIAIDEIDSLQFSDPGIQAEIDKALARSLQQIKPNSTFVELAVSAKSKSADAVVQYTIPAAAWKISYRMILDGEEPIGFHGHAIVDNNTDEDWKDFWIAVVMGQPITFTTDLAQSKIPNRSHVNIVQEAALGAVLVEEAMEEVERFAVDAMTRGGGPGGGERMSSAKRKASVYIADSDMMQQAAASKKSPPAPAAADPTAVTETGDFCIFECTVPVSIDAHRSAVIPVFQTELGESSAVLHYRETNHPERPYQSIRFKNTTEHSLGRGVCTVYDQTTYAGTCVVPATKPGADALLPHALETSVKVRRTDNPIKNRCIGIRLSDGVGYESHHQTSETEYLINSTRKDARTFILDHDWRLPDAEVTVELTREGSKPVSPELTKLKHASRLDFELEASEKVLIKVTEKRVSKSRVKLIGKKPEDELFRLDWLINNVVESDSSISNDPGVARCIEIQRSIDQRSEQISAAINEIEKFSNRQERLRKNIKSSGADEQSKRWKADLARAEDAIVKVEEEELPGLREAQRELKVELFEAVKELALEWKQ